MMSKTSVQALKAVVALAKVPQGQYGGVGAIARQTHVPENYLGKVLRLLAGRGLLESQKGLGGGFRLARDPRKITLYEIVEVIDNLSRWEGCVLGQPSCSDETSCALHEKWKDVKGNYMHFLTETSVWDVASRKAA